MKKHSKFWSENRTRRDKTIILKWKPDKQGVWEWSEFNLLIICVGSHEHDNKLKYSVKAGNIFTAVVFQDVAPYRVVDRYPSYGEDCCLHLQGRRQQNMQKQ
jgi:hypothetical protein